MNTKPTWPAFCIPFTMDPRSPKRIVNCHVPEHSSVAVVDSRRFMRDLLSLSLKAVGFEVFAAPSIDEYIESGNAHSPSVALISIGDGSNRYDTWLTLRRVTESMPQTRIAVLADGEDLTNVPGIMQFGARGYISTAMPFDEVVEALSLVRAGGQFLPAACSSASLTTDAAIHTPLKSRTAGIFTAGQTAVVKALCQGKGNKMIAHELNIAESTVKVHIRIIMRKLKATNRTQVAYIASQLAR